ncbi:MAG: GspE/PulE family protein [Patescibacteria group bacterium]
MNLDNKQLRAILVDGDYLSAGDWQKAEAVAAKKEIDIIDYLLREGILNKDLFGQAMAEYFSLPYADLNSNMPIKEQVLALPEDIAREYRLVVYSADSKTVVVATDQPDNQKLPELLKKVIPNRQVKLAYSLTEDIDAAFVNYRKTLETRFAAIIKKSRQVVPEIVDEIFADAVTFKASDIHFEPTEAEVLVRFRVDGVLQDAGHIPKEFYGNIVNRIKVKSHLRIDEHFAAQDGSLNYVSDGLVTDMRVSVVPTIEGEKIVMRLLSHYVQGFDLNDLGLSVKDQTNFNVAAQKPFGMILVVGPTGSGKSTTLYAVLKQLNQPAVNITTIEDPVEYRVPGINQIQVNSQTGLTFARGLRSIVRQDPDIILVGEIRDLETAEIAVNAALTGHLLLSTFHSNDAATGIPRLLDMKIEPFLLASTLQAILAQRLVRKICDHCRVSYTISPAQLTKEYPLAAKYFPRRNLTLYRGKGCPACNNTGYKGRTAIFELILITPEMQELVMKHPSSREIWQLASRQGSRPLFEDGMEKVKDGVTTMDEIFRVAEPPQ